MKADRMKAERMKAGTKKSWNEIMMERIKEWNE